MSLRIKRGAVSQCCMLNYFKGVRQRNLPNMAERSLSNKQKREHAKLLYTRDGITVYKEIARRVNATEHSIGRWAKEDNWELYRKNMLLTREEQMQNLLNELAELNEFIKQKPEGKRFANAKEGDVRRKLIKDIKELE